jgi:hypothetical protein
VECGETIRAGGHTHIPCSVYLRRLYDKNQR